MTFIHPALRPQIEASIGKSLLADEPVEEVRKGAIERARKRPAGPGVDRVFDASVPARGRSIPVRVYHPKGAESVVLAFHGGSWAIGNLDTFDFTARHIANDSGQVVVSVGYRLAPENQFPAALDDAWEATAWVAAYGAEWQLPSGKIVLLGDSAGGNLAAAVAIKARDVGAPNILLQVLIYPPLDATAQGGSLERFAEGYLLTMRDVAFGYENYGLGKMVEPTDWRLSPLLAASHVGVAPALLISAELDPLVDQATAYAERLADAGVAVAHVVYKGVTHLFFGMRETLYACEQAQRQAAFAIRSIAAQRGI